MRNHVPAEVCAAYTSQNGLNALAKQAAEDGLSTLTMGHSLARALRRLNCRIKQTVAIVAFSTPRAVALGFHPHVLRFQLHL